MDIEDKIEKVGKKLLYEFISTIIQSESSPLITAEDYKLQLINGIIDEKSFDIIYQKTKDSLELEPYNYASVQAWFKILLPDPDQDYKVLNYQNRVAELILAKAYIQQIMYVEGVINRLREKPFSRDLTWLYGHINDSDFISFNNNFIEKYCRLDFDILKAKYVMANTDPNLVEADFIQLELDKFNRLFEPNLYDEDWYEFSDLFAKGCSTEELKELYLACLDIKNGKYLEIITSPYYGRQKHFAMAKAIVEYIKFLEQQQIRLKNLIKTFVVKGDSVDPSIDKITKTWAILSDGGFIDCDLEVFQSIFNKEKIDTKVRWCKKIVELGYFLHGIGGVDFNWGKEPIIIFTGCALEGNHTSTTLDQIGRDCFIKSNNDDIAEGGIRNPNSPSPISKSHQSKLDIAIKTLRGKHY